MNKDDFMIGEDLYTIGEVAAMLGVSTHTVRAWERRHGMVHPQRTGTRHRRYRPEEVALLRNVRHAAHLNGVSLRLAYQSVSEAQPLDLRISNLDRKTSEQSLPLNDGNVWRALVDVIPQFVALIDGTGAVVECNIVAAKTFGAVVQQLTRRSLVDLVDPFDRGKAEMLYRPTLRAVSGWDLNLATPEGPRTFSFQTWFVRQDRTTMLALVGSRIYVPVSPTSHPDG